MGSELVSDSPPLSGGGSDNGPAPVTFTEQFYNHLPYYLAIGMTYDQFWNDDCCLVKYYRQAHELKRRERNQELWVQGAYFYEALVDVAPVLHAFAKKGAKTRPYISSPFPLTQQDVREQKKRDAKVKYDKQMAKVLSWVKQVNTSHQKQIRKEDEET